MRRSSFTDLNMRNSRHAYGCSRRGTCHGLSPLHVRPERSPLHDVRQHAHASGPIEGSAWHARICFTDEPVEGRPATCHRWWSQTESNRRPPACKAGALPTELWPRAVTWLANRSSRRAAQASPFRASSGNLRIAFANEGWWAWEDLNFRPHAYQARALTS